MRNTKNMAFIVCTMLLLVVMTNANAIVLCDDDNTKTIIYDYDAAGNRISRGGEINNAKQRSRITGNMRITHIKYGDAKFDFYRNNFMLKELEFIGKEKG